MNRCSGICKTGKQCKRVLKNGSVCKYHFNDDCPICLSDSKTDLIRTECGHFFHKKCLQNWLETNNTCPVCRFQIGPDMMVRFRLSVLPDTSKPFHFLVDVPLEHSENIDYVVSVFYEIMSRDCDYQHIVNSNQEYSATISVV